MSSFVKHARSLGLDGIKLMDEDGEERPRSSGGDRAEVPSMGIPSGIQAHLDPRLAGLVFTSAKRAGHLSFTNLFRSGTLPTELNAEDGLTGPSRLRYRLRRYRVRKKKHPRPVHRVDDQREEFRKRRVMLGAGGPGSISGSGRSADWLGSSSMVSSGQASRYRILNQLRLSVASTRKQSARAKALESVLQKKSSRSETMRKSFLDPEAAKMIRFDEHQFHPVETTQWEDQIVMDESDITGWEERRLTPKFVQVCQLPNAPAKPVYSSALLSYLASRAPSGYSTPPIIRSSSSGASGNLQNLLKRPQSEATRVTNAELEAGVWADSIIWDDEEAPKRLPPTRLILDVNDPYMVFDLDSGAQGEGGGLSLKDLARMTKLINKAKAKKGMNGPSASLQPAQPVTKAINYSKPQSSDKFNLSNDKYYEATSQPTADGSASVSKATRQSMAKSQLAARIGLQHSVPAIKLLQPFFPTGWSRTELRSWHRPTIQTPVEPAWTFNTINNKASTQSTGLQAQVLRNAKKIGLRDGSEYALVEYSEECPLLMMNSGMATFLLHFWRKPATKDQPIAPPPAPSYGTLKVLEPTDPSPFWMFGDVQAGQSLTAMQNNLFRALLFEHASSQQDFLVIRSHVKGKPGSKFYLRALPANTLLVGQVFPTASIPGPHSRKQNMFARARVQVFAYRLFAKDATAATTGRPRLKIARILSAFPQYSEGSVRKWLKEYAESVRQGTDSGVWQRKADAPVLGEDDLRALVSPEMVCTNESMLVGQQRLQDAGVDLRTGPGSNTDDLDDGDDDEAALLDEDTAAEVQLAPWNLSANLANAILGKSALQLRGSGDPSGGRGEAFSFLRIPSKMAAAKIPDSTGIIPTLVGLLSLLCLDEGVKRTKGGNVDQAAYKQEIAKIWAAQIKALSDPNPPQPEQQPATASTGTDAWNDILRNRPADDDETTSLHSASHTGASTTGRSDKSRRRLVVTRTVADPNGGTSIETETLNDPYLIQAYLKERKQLDTKLKRRQQLAAASAARAASRPPKPVSIKAPAIPREPKPPKPKKQISIRCGTCGAIGHMRTNRICPLYEQYEAEMALMAATGETRGTPRTLSELSVPEPGAVRVQGTKISITKATLVTTVAQQRALSQWSLFLQDVLAAITASPSSWPFRRPVSRKEYPHYFRMISKPIDLGTIKSRARRQVYRSVDSFRADIRLIMTNCVQFNLEDHPFSVMAKEVVAEADRMLEQKKEQIDAWMDELNPNRNKEGVQPITEEHGDHGEHEDVVMEDAEDHEHDQNDAMDDMDGEAMDNGMEDVHDQLEVQDQSNENHPTEYTEDVEMIE